MQADTAHPPSSYEDNLLELLQAVSPGKKLKKEDIPWDNVRAYLIEEIIRRSTKPNQRVRYVPRPIDGVPHAELSLYRLERPKHGLDAKESAFFKNLKIYMLPKEERKLVKLRQKRRALHQSSSFFRLDCEERDLPSAFSRNYHALIIHRKHPSQCLRIILNSLTEYFSRRTWPTNVKKTVSDYLRQCVLKSGSDLCQPSDRQIPLAYLQLETELACLFEIYLLEAFPKATVHDTDIFTKLNLLHHIFDGETLKKALNETLCDEFAHIHGKALTEIYEWFNLPIPADLLKYESQSHKISTDWGFEESLTKNHEDEENTENANRNSSSQTPSAPVTRRTSRSSGSSDEVTPVRKSTRKTGLPKVRSESTFTFSFDEEEVVSGADTPSPSKGALSPNSIKYSFDHGMNLLYHEPQPPKISICGFDESRMQALDGDEDVVELNGNSDALIPSTRASRRASRSSRSSNDMEVVLTMQAAVEEEPPKFESGPESDEIVEIESISDSTVSQTSSAAAVSARTPQDSESRDTIDSLPLEKVLSVSRVPNAPSESTIAYALDEEDLLNGEEPLPATSDPRSPPISPEYVTNDCIDLLEQDPHAQKSSTDWYSEKSQVDEEVEPEHAEDTSDIIVRQRSPTPVTPKSSCSSDSNENIEDGSLLPTTSTARLANDPSESTIAYSLNDEDLLNGEEILPASTDSRPSTLPEYNTSACVGTLDYDPHSQQPSADWCLDQLQEEEDEAELEDDANDVFVRQLSPTSITRKLSRSPGSTEDTEVAPPAPTASKARSPEVPSEITVAYPLAEAGLLNGEESLLASTNEVSSVSPDYNAVACIEPLDEDPRAHTSNDWYLEKSQVNDREEAEPEHAEDVNDGTEQQLSPTHHATPRSSRSSDFNEKIENVPPVPTTSKARMPKIPSEYAYLYVLEEEVQTDGEDAPPAQSRFTGSFEEEAPTDDEDEPLDPSPSGSNLQRPQIIFTSSLEDEAPTDDEDAPSSSVNAVSLISEDFQVASSASLTPSAADGAPISARSRKRANPASEPSAQISKTRKRELRSSTDVICRSKSAHNVSTSATLASSSVRTNKNHRSLLLRAQQQPKAVVSPSKPPLPTASAAKNAASVLGDAALKEYRQRMDVINRSMSRREQQDHEVFYGRGSVRRNLFETQEDSPALELAKPSARQKSRSGRAVKQMEDDSCLHIAHTLLNVQNTTPHLPYKLVVNGDTPVPFRVKKLLRRVTRAQQKRIVKFRQNAKLLQKVSSADRNTSAAVHALAGMGEVENTSDLPSSIH